MLSDPITLYKLMILYMLDHVNFPLTNSQLTDFFLDHEYTTYFTLQQALNELKEAGLIRMESTHNSSRYEITKEGDDTLSFFGNNISPAIIEDIDSYLKENKFRLRNEVGVISDFYKSTNQDYIVHCEVREGKSILIGFDLSVPDKDQAETMASHWKERSQEIYSYVMKTLMKGLHSLIPVPSLRFPLPSQPFSQPIPRLSPPGSPPRRSEDLLRQPSCR